MIVEKVRSKTVVVFELVVKDSVSLGSGLLSCPSSGRVVVNWSGSSRVGDGGRTWVDGCFGILNHFVLGRKEFPAVSAILASCCSRANLASLKVLTQHCRES